MAETRIPKGKLLFLFAILAIYLLFGAAIKYLVVIGAINPSIKTIEDDLSLENPTLSEVPFRLEIAKTFLNEKMLKPNGHINLEYNPSNTKELQNTNSEAISYYLLWNTISQDKPAVDKELVYLKGNMMHPTKNYLMWRLNSQDKAVGDGENIATDADLRAIKALLIADKQWPNSGYGQVADNLASPLEEIAITKDSLFAPYGGFTNGEVWKTEEVWLSYADFEVFNLLAEKRGQPWKTVYTNMKKAVLASQLPNGLYNTQLDEKRNYHNELDQGSYSLNGLWVMVRAAESKDKDLQESSQKALDFYKEKFESDGAIYISYDSRGSSVSQSESPWVYALVARAAIELGDKPFSESMISKLLEFQETDETSELLGAIVEGSALNKKVSQFTMQESIITLQDYTSKSLSEGN